MDNSATISWIFLAIALSSDKFPVDFKGITQVADGINHAVPSHKEIQDSVSWLLRKDLIIKTSNKYSLSDYGNRIFSDSKSISNLIFDILKNVENIIKYI